MDTSIKQTVDYGVENTIIRVTFDDITQVDADALVSSDNNRLTMETGVSRAIRKAAGEDVYQEAHAHAPLSLSDVVVTSAGKLSPRYIFHAVTVDFDKKVGPSERSLAEVTRKCLQLADTLGVRRIAFPALGTGALSVPFQAAAAIMTRAIVEYIQQGTRLEQVIIVLFAPRGADPGEMGVFHGALANLAVDVVPDDLMLSPPPDFEHLLVKRKSKAAGATKVADVDAGLVARGGVSPTQASTDLSLDVHIARPLLAAGQSNERYVLLTLKAPQASREAQAEQGRLPLNISLVIDHSGSMSGRKLAYVKRAAIHALQFLTEKDRVSVIIYDDEIDVLASSQPVTPEVRRRIIQHIEAIRSGGTTNLSDGWLKGAEQVADFMNEDTFDRVLLLTDGLANRGVTDHEALVMHAKDLRKRTISTSTFGVGEDFNQFLLQGLADNGGGHFYYIDAPDQIPNYFEGELGEMLTTVVRDMTLDIETPAGVKLDVINDLPTEALKNGTRMMLGGAYSGEERQLALRLTLPAEHIGPPASHLALALKLMYEDVGLGRASGVRQILAVEDKAITFTVATPGASAAQPVDEATLTTCAQIQVERAKMEAMKLEYQGDTFGAQQILRLTAEALEAYLPSSLATPFIENLRKEAEEIKRGRSAQARKTGHYTSYITHHGRRDYKK
jgi:Ca-activated chloride channel family protein